MTRSRRPLVLLVLAGALQLPALASAEPASTGSASAGSASAGSASTGPANTEPASAEPSEPAVSPAAIDEAEQLAEQAFDAYVQRDFRRSIALYEMALAAAPSADILYNIARVYDLGLSDTPNAVAYYRRYIAHSRAQRPRSELALQRIRELSGDGAAPLPSAGAAAMPASGTTGLGLSLADGTEHAAAGSESATTWTTSELTAAALTGAGAVALSVGIGFGVSAYAERDSWRSQCDGNRCASQSAVDAARSASRKANVATLALASGGGLLALAAGFWWLAPSMSAGGVALQVSPASSAAELGCTLSGAF